MNHRIALACLIALLLTGLAVTTASAHAYLIRSEPASGALLGQAPDQVKLWFDELVELEFSQVQVIDANHARVDLGKLQYLANDHQAISAQLKPIPDGIYSVIWRVLSAADGHVTTGVFPFSVGNVADSAPTPVSASTESEPETSPVSVITRWINLLATLTFVGGFFYRLFLLDRSTTLLQIDNESLTRNWQRLADAAFIGALASAVVGLILQASAVANVSFAQALAFDPLTRTLFNTNFGILWMIRNGALLAIDLLYLVIHRVTRKYLPPIFGALALLTYSLGSHDAGVGGMFSALVLSDWLHLLAVAIWVGGLFHFLMSVWTARRALADDQRARWVAWMIPQFSTIAIVATAVIAFTGLVSILAQAHTLDQVLNTQYGRTLLIKIGLFLVMIGFGAANQFWLTPRFRKTVQAPAESAKLFTGFRAGLTSESTVGVIVLLLAALLTLTPPPRSRSAPTAPVVVSNSIYLEQNLSGDVHVELTIRPDATNPSDFDARVTNGKTNAPLTDLQRVIFSFTYLDSDTGIARVNGDPRPDAHYSVSGNETPLDGLWLVEVLVRRQGLEDVIARFPLLRGKDQVKPTEPAAMQLLQASDMAMNALTSVRSQQVLNDGTNGSLVTDYTFHAPNEMSYVVKGVGASIAIGPLQYYQEKDGSWTVRERVQPLVFPSFTNSTDASVATLGRAAVLNGEETQVVRFRIGTAGGDVTEFAAWVSNQDKRVRQFAMVAPSHYMVQTYFDYDAQHASIAPPANVVLPTPAPTPVTANIPAPSRTRPSGPITGDLEADAALVVMVAGIIVGLVSSDRKRPRRWRLVVLGVAIVLIGASIFLFVDAVTAQQSAVANTPIDTSAANVGQSLYEKNCLSCHGTSTKGDGPAAAALPAKPFDLTVHVPQHDDLYLLTTISNGRGYMPAWKDKLTTAQIQQIIAYLRVVALRARSSAPAFTPAPGFTPGP